LTKVLRKVHQLHESQKGISSQFWNTMKFSKQIIDNTWLLSSVQCHEGVSLSWLEGQSINPIISDDKWQRVCGWKISNSLGIGSVSYHQSISWIKITYMQTNLLLPLSTIGKTWLWDYSCHCVI
jgi:hypothetical protein